MIWPALIIGAGFALLGAGVYCGLDALGEYILKAVREVKK
jgi:thioredoxin reductase